MEQSWLSHGNCEEKQRKIEGGEGGIEGGQRGQRRAGEGEQKKVGHRKMRGGRKGEAEEEGRRGKTG